MTLRRLRNSLLLWCAMACLSVLPLRASEYHGLVTFGGLPVPGTTVTATQGTTKSVAVTDNQGLYSFPNLADGTWTVEIQMTGFSPVKQDVTVSASTPAGAFELKLMSLAEIRAAAKPVKVDPSVTAPVASALPAPAAPNAAGAKGAAAPGKPGAAPAKGAAAPTQTASNAVPEPPTPAEAQSQQANDGLLINGSVNNAATSQYALSQAFGNNRMNGKSLYNGGLVLVLDNSALNAKQYSLSGFSSPNPTYNNLTAGINFGGPLKIPHLMPRGPFFFLGYQRVQNTNNVISTTLVPTLTQRNGDLSLIAQPIYVPKTYSPTSGLAASSCTGMTPGQKFAGNIIPTGCISSSAKTLLGYYPLPNIAGNQLYNYQIVLPGSQHQDMFQGQLNKNFGNKNFLNGRFQFQSSRRSIPNLFGFKNSTNQLNFSINGSWYHRFTQRLSVNTSYNFSRGRTQQNSNFANKQNVAALANINGVDSDPAFWGPPGLSFNSGFAGLSDGPNSNTRNLTNGLTVEVQWNRSRHNVAMGGEFRLQQFNYLDQSNPRGRFVFNSTATNGGVSGPAGSDFADLLLGIPDTSSVAFGNADKYLRQSVYALYARDDFRVNPEFSVNAGVRWEYGAPVTETQGRLANLDIASGFGQVSPVVGSSPTGALTGHNYQSSLVHPDKSGIAPNVGIAWRPISGSSLLIRAGYQISHDTSVYQSAAYSMATQAFATPLTKSASLNNSTCLLSLVQGFPSCPTITSDTFALDPNFRVGYVQTWQLSAQRDLPASLQAVVTYRGTKGTRGVQEFLPNTCPYSTVSTACTSAPTGYVYRTSNGNSTREEGIATVRRRLRSGFTANLTYTFSKSIDDDYSFGGGQGTAVNAQVAQDWTHPERQRGLSTFDQRHVLAASLQYTTGMGLGGRTLMSGWKGALYKEWTLLTNITAGSGLPQTPLAALAVPGTGYSNIIRAHYTGAPIYQESAGRFLNPAAYTLPLDGQWGDARRNSIIGPNQFSLNASMDRTFRLHDRYNLETRLDATNALNHVVYSGYNTTVGNSQFGAPSSVKDMRVIQLTMRLRY